MSSTKKWLTVFVPIMTLHIAAAADWTFTDVSESAGAAWRFKLDTSNGEAGGRISGGVAAGDYDRDGDIDLYVMTGDTSANALLRNDSDGHFTNVSEAAGTGLDGHRGQGPTFADIDTDGWPDLVIGGIAGSGYRVLKNNGDGSFSEVQDQAGIVQQSLTQDDYSSAFGDVDGDGDLDVFITHWGADTPINHLWTNTGDGHFIPADKSAGIDLFFEDDWSFTPIFTDTDGDGRQDLLVTGDFGTSQCLKNAGRGSFTLTTTEAIDDENGMGATSGDFDNDSDTDWFVSSIYDKFALSEDWGQSGNRLYSNNGNGTFNKLTETAGVADGYWGWGACSADFNNDGWLDIFHVNGMPRSSNQRDFNADPSRLFINQKDGTFTESSIALGINDSREGRGVVCFDYDKDGDIDIFISNYGNDTRLYRNDLDENPGWLQVQLDGGINNPSAVGAVIKASIGEVTQMREVTIGSNYQSQNPLLQHFGLDGARQVDEIRVNWPHGAVTTLTDVMPNQVLKLSAMSALPPPFNVESGHSSAWYDETHNGEGFLLEILDNNIAVVYWFTYDRDGNQDWYTSVGKVVGRRVLFSQLLRVSGGEFGPGFDPENIVRTVVGSAAFTFTSCNIGFMDWSLNDASGTESSGRLEVKRITGLMGLDCGFAKGIPERPEGRYSGSWYDPDHDGEGFAVEVLFDNKAVVYWFSHGLQGKRRWFFGVGELSEGKLIFDEMLSTSGGIFGDEFEPGAVQYLPWGSLALDISCAGGTATWSSTEEGFGSGVLNIQKLTKLADLNCDD